MSHDAAMTALVRPMRPDDVADAERLSAEAFLELERTMRTVGDPEPRRRSDQRAARWRERTEHLLATDPGGCWVAERDDGMAGFATSLRRDLTWILATFAVRPGLQAQGVGRSLLEAASSHSRGCLRGMLAASDDPRALRLYRLAGFSLHPQLYLHGIVDRSALPADEGVRDGSEGDIDLMDSIDRRVRDAAHGPDHPVLARSHRLLIVDRSTGSGYAYADESGQPVLWAATTRRTAARLLWAALAGAPAGEPIEIAHVTAVNEWAVDVGLAARLSIGVAGHLALRGMKPPVPYLHHGSLL